MDLVEGDGGVVAPVSVKVASDEEWIENVIVDSLAATDHTGTRGVKVSRSSTGLHAILPEDYADHLEIINSVEADNIISEGQWVPVTSVHIEGVQHG